MSQHTEIAGAIRKAGNRLTLQRTSIIEIIATSDGHLTAPEILDQVRARFPYFTKSTVYRNLELLADLGLITRTDLGQGHIEYELHRHPHHHHLVCRRCGKIEQVKHTLLVPLEKSLLKSYGFQAELDHFAIFGTCHKCQKQESQLEVSHAHS